MLKRIGIPVIALAAMLTLFSPHQASAAVRFGVYVGAPLYRAYPPYPPYAYPYPVPDYYGYPSAYAYPTPYYTYSRPYVYRTWRWRNHERREWLEHRGREFRERGRGWRR
jgi:hypothetical protein